MSDNHKLEYQRRGFSYVGTFDGEAFSDLRFSEMMLMVSERLTDGRGLEVIRLERPGLLPIVLTSGQLAILKNDPQRYIREHSLPQRTVDLTDGKKRTSKLATQEKAVLPRTVGLRAGYDTLAAAFGHRLYMRLRDGKIESPVDGRWCTLTALVNDLCSTDVELHCSNSNDGWASVSTLTLVAANYSKFFFPREWNTWGNWITKEQLIELYDRFMKDSGELCSEEKTIQ